MQLSILTGPQSVNTWALYWECRKEPLFDINHVLNYFRPLQLQTYNEPTNSWTTTRNILLIFKTRNIKFHGAVKLIWAHAVQFVNKKNLAHNERSIQQTKQDYSNQNCWTYLCWVLCSLCKLYALHQFGRRGILTGRSGRADKSQNNKV